VHLGNNSIALLEMFHMFHIYQPPMPSAYRSPLAENLKLAKQCERKFTVIFDSDKDIEPGIIGEASLQERYHYKDASDFYERYLEKKEQSKE
jgi:hypothetical protein